MSRKGTRSIAEPIAPLQRELEEYRRMQPRRAKLPESIWEAAAEARARLTDAAKAPAAATAELARTTLRALR